MSPGATMSVPKPIKNPRAAAPDRTGGLRLTKCTLNSVIEISPEAILLLIESVKPTTVIS